MDGENGMLTMEDYSEVGVIDRNDEYVNNANNVMSPITAAAIMAVDEGGDTSSGESGSEYNSIDDEENDVDVTVKHMKEHGVDMQGIDWTNVYCSRADFRRSRNKSVQPFRSVNDSLNSVISIPEDQMLKQDPRFTFFSFVSSRLSEKCAFLHFQLRHLLSSPSKVQVFYANLSSIRRWNPVSRKSEHILDAQNIPNMEPVRISSMAASKECIFVGGFMGEVLIKPLYQNNVHLYQQASRDAGSIINHISVCSLGPSFTFEEKVCLSCNDKSIKILDLRKLVSETILQLPFPVNCSAFSSDYRLLCAVGDDPNAVILDVRTGKEECRLTGHLDYSFACSWSPNGRWIATGNQDNTSRIYDVRNLAKTLHIVPSTMSCPRSISFSSNGKYMAIAESSDYVHILQVRGRDGHSCPPFQRCQTIDFFSDIGGISFTPQSDSFFIGCSDNDYGCIMEFHFVEDKPSWPQL